MTASIEPKYLQAMARGLDPDPGVLGFNHYGQVYVYETEEETRRQFAMASWDTYVFLVRFINNKWEVSE